MTKTKSEAEGEFYNATLQREDKRNATRDAITYLLATTGAVGWWHRCGLAELDAQSGSSESTLST